MNDNIGTINKSALLFNTIFISLIMVLFYFINVNNSDISKLKNDRFEMIKLSDKLRQSSDDLSHFARTYAETFDEVYKKQYFDTLDIRNGLKNRPVNYDKIYWDLEKSIREKKHPDGKKNSLKDMMKKLPYSKKELTLLSRSENNSNDLVNLENEAFNAMKGLYKDIFGNYTIRKEVNQKLARTLLHSKNYYKAKHKIMNPIDDFMIILDERTFIEISAVQKSIDRKFVFLYLVLAVFVFVNIMIFFILKKFNRKIKIDLEKKINEGIIKNRKKDQLLSQQSKLASMGEMIGNIAHQWRQPLNALAMSVQFLEDDFEEGMLDKKYLLEYTSSNMKLINFMSKTIDDFRDFFKSNKIKENFSVQDCINNPLNILKLQLKELDIQIYMSGTDFSINGLKSEFQQVILNIVNNARDALVENKIQNGTINIKTSLENKIGTITIDDNAGGIPSESINRVFEPYYTTKEEGKGTGIGLYMSKIIITENMQGELAVSNIGDGACFEIKLNLQKNN